MFSLGPTLIEISMTLVVFGTLFDWKFLVVELISIVFYLVSTYCLTECRAKDFKAQTLADQNYNQVATDSLLNFETVKYFNAEQHEENRFENGLNAYKIQAVKVARSLVGLNVSQSMVISLGLSASLTLAYSFILKKTLTIGGFVMFQ